MLSSRKVIGVVLFARLVNLACPHEQNGLRMHGANGSPRTAPLTAPMNFPCAPCCAWPVGVRRSLRVEHADNLVHPGRTIVTTPLRWPRQLALRGGSSAWSDALVQASVNGARNHLSVEDTCAALKTHGLVASVDQVKELLRFGGATDFEHVNEAQFSAALAMHPPSSALGRWQQVWLNRGNCR